MEPIEAVTKRERVRAMRWGGGEVQAGEVTRWLDKWDIENNYVSRGGHEYVVVWDSHGIDFTLLADGWVVYYPKSGNIAIYTDAEFKAKYE